MNCECSLKKMGWKEKTVLIIFLSLASSILIAAFIGIWSLFRGALPATNTIKITNAWVLQLTFLTSRWWTVLTGPVWSIIFVMIFTNHDVREENNMPSGVNCGLDGAMPFALFFGLLISLLMLISTEINLGTCLITNMILGLIIGLWCAGYNFQIYDTLFTRLSARLSSADRGEGATVKLIIALISSLIAGLGASVCIGLIHGFVAAFISGLAVFLCIVLIYWLLVGLRYFFLP